MPHEGLPTPSANDRPGFHSDMPVSDLTKRVTRANEASDVSSTTLVVGTTDGVTTTKTSCYARGLEESWTRKETK